MVKFLAPRPWILNALQVLQVPGPKRRTRQTVGKGDAVPRKNTTHDSYSRQGRDSDTLLTDLVLVWGVLVVLVVLVVLLVVVMCV